jgi:hypothetical protein
MQIEYWWESQNKRDHYEDQVVGGWMILKLILREIGIGGIYCIDLAQDRGQWRVHVNTVMNLRVP